MEQQYSYLVIYNTVNRSVGYCSMYSLLSILSSYLFPQQVESAI